ncbi:MAG TPA: hypothetical protein VE866_10405, partial [Candidatus Binatia bacterium]|nr:hypothetical protein [Candidatus Binatia bacterium]
MVFVQGTNQTASINWAAMNGARRNLEAEWDIKLGLFELKTTPKDYEHLALRLPTFHPPELMIVLKNGSMTLYSGELTQSNVVQEFVHAVNSGGCCPLGEHE